MQEIALNTISTWAITTMWGVVFFLQALQSVYNQSLRACSLFSYCDTHLMFMWLVSFPFAVRAAAAAAAAAKNRPGLPHFRLAGQLLCVSVWSRWPLPNRLALSLTSEQPYNPSPNCASTSILTGFTQSQAGVFTTQRWPGSGRSGSRGQRAVITCFLRVNSLVENNGGGDPILGAHKRRQPLCDLEAPVSVFLYFYVVIAVINSATRDSNHGYPRIDNVGRLMGRFWTFILMFSLGGGWWGMGNLSAARALCACTQCACGCLCARGSRCVCVRERVPFQNFFSSVDKYYYLK